VAALTARNIPRSKVSGYGHKRVMRPQPPVRQQIESNAPAALGKKDRSLLEGIITKGVRVKPFRALTVTDALIDQSKPTWHPVPPFEKYRLP